VDFCAHRFAGGLILWLAFPHAVGMAVLVFVLVMGFMVFSRRRQLPMNRWP
jgi:hypothetical protein